MIIVFIHVWIIHLLTHAKRLGGGASDSIALNAFSHKRRHRTSPVRTCFWQSPSTSSRLVRSLQSVDHRKWISYIIAWVHKYVGGYPTRIEYMFALKSNHRTKGHFRFATDHCSLLINYIDYNVFFFSHCIYHSTSVTQTNTGDFSGSWFQFATTLIHTHTQSSQSLYYITVHTFLH